MPTYVCSVPAGSLTITQKTAVAEAIARIHSEATGTPQFLVQVIIDENQSVDRFLGGQLTTNHVWIRGDIRAGRTEEQREQLMLHIIRDAPYPKSRTDCSKPESPVQNKAEGRFDRLIQKIKN